MFEAKLGQSGQIKKLIEAIKDIVSDANLECNENGISLQVSRYRKTFYYSFKTEKRQWIPLMFLLFL
jgi:hypothetical protein